MREFKYDILQLIEAVKNRPCIWDKTSEEYKDRYQRRKSWEEIFNELDDEYESMSSEEKRLTGEQVLNKWTNMRDTFIKSLRPRMGKPRRRYMLHDYLTFLCNDEEIAETAEPANEYTYMKEEEASGDNIIIVSKKRKRQKSDDSNYEPNTSNNSSPKTKSKKTVYERNDNVSDIDFIGVEDINSSADHNRLMNEDEAFFASLLPTVVKYSEDERLEFRIEVLNLMKRIKDGRNWNSSDA